MNRKPSEPSPADFREDPERTPPEESETSEVPSEGGAAEQESSAHPS